MPGVPLSAAGRAQASALAASLAGENIARIETSPLERARETAAAVADAVSAGEPVIQEALIEIDMGHWTGAAFDELADDPDWRRWNEERGTARIPGGETMAEAQARIVGHLRQLAAEPGDTTVAVVTHSDMIRGAVAWLLGLPLGHVHRFEIGPASVTRMVIGNWGGKLMSLNERAC